MQTASTECRHFCPQCRTAHAHVVACAYPAAPQVCPQCYPAYIARLVG
jgi:hypothetical protein